MKKVRETPEYEVTSSRMKDIPAPMRPREMFEKMGAENLSDEMLLALVLRSGTRGLNVLDLARELLRKYGSLTALAKASTDDLVKTPGLGKVKAQILKSILEIACRLSREQCEEQPTIRQPQEAARLLRERARTKDEESFWVLLLDAKYRLKKSPMEISRGLLDASLVHPREVFREAIRSATAAVVLVHNHPSGDPTPSAEDIRITKQLVEAGRIIDIQVLDHIILGKHSSQMENDFFSFREAGIVNFAVK